MSGRRLFVVYLKCDCCLRVQAHNLRVPIEEDAPSTVEELIDSAALRNIRFSCPDCDSSIATTVAVKDPVMEDQANAA
jgi:hypothetical protein